MIAIDGGEGDARALFDWGRFGFLIADLFTALALLFLVANSIGKVQILADSGSRYEHGPAPIICGLDQPSAAVSFTIQNADGVRRLDPGAVQAFADQAHQVFADAAKAGRIIGEAEVFGGSYQGNLDPQNGQTLAIGAIAGLKVLGTQNYVFSEGRTLYQSFWDGSLTSSQIYIIPFFYRVSVGVPCSF